VSLTNLQQAIFEEFPNIPYPGDSALSGLLVGGMRGWHGSTARKIALGSELLRPVWRNRTAMAFRFQGLFSGPFTRLGE
jgi:hypothetical protein